MVYNKSGHIRVPWGILKKMFTVRANLEAIIQTSHGICITHYLIAAWRTLVTLLEELIIITG